MGRLALATVSLVAFALIPSAAAGPLDDVRELAEETTSRTSANLDGPVEDVYRSCSNHANNAQTLLPGHKPAIDCRETCEKTLDFLERTLPGYWRPLSCPDPGLGDLPTDGAAERPALNVAVPVDVAPTGLTWAPDATAAERTLGAREERVSIASGPSSVETDLPGPGWWPWVAGAVALGMLPLVWLYRRLAPGDLLENEVRRRALDTVTSEPGSTAADVAREVDVHYVTARYHLEKLREYGEVERRRFGGRVRYFVNHGRFGRIGKRVRSALASKPKRAILETLASEGELPAGEIADRLDVAPSTASFHLGQLSEEEVLERRREGREIRYTLAPGVEGSLLDADRT